ncbi:double-strand break repair helicase AddA [Parvibaculum sp.]|jgi:ATP-dependent helicase/nuclease subunit A|uniref:double-strand break repair helicase AddA n=3 Tax=Parvibaculum sp. TaxID=2024848 RepID=UPI001B07B3A5|nr:double-strand break repair helicase AddA [Parvibaculum sp.]MBO6632953.1 double-strand break repair helicase AddA [Parvibaculum sp.]MBO6677732.1 double-strand break repair helicase AddA [Parvibaculum sp.]MBO6903347.1 double-strand break repair helicase AddA [Parvibaculum sp.]
MSGSARKDLAPDEAQRRASHPETSVWVSANAGSGKTHALTTRVARLLLAGTEPERILCLTFTKAAAAEMSARLYKRLGGWATMADEELAPAIADMEGRTPDGAKLATARRLFARAVETPGGLKIQTIHAFCERLLGRFPLEADVPPQFEILDERRAQELMDEVRDTVLRRASESPETPLGIALSHVVERVDELTFGKLLSEVTGKRGNFAKLLARFGGLEGIRAAIRVALSVEEGESVEALLEEITTPPDAAMRRAAEVLAGGTKTDAERAAALNTFFSSAAQRDAVDTYTGIFLTKEMMPRKTLITKKLGEENPETAQALEAEQARIVRLVGRMKALRVAEATEAIVAIAVEILRTFEEAKQARALLDYDDLIAKARALLTTSAMAPWVLYKLDGGIDHILVDEAQDTSPEQWDVVARIADEFLSGTGAREVTRTIFAVGDEKQSIFSFQGADPARFDEMKRYFEKRVKAAELAWDYVPLTRSFRSAPEVLGAVDRVFELEKARNGLTASGDVDPHIAHRALDAGLVEIWDLEEPEEGEEASPWDAPLDYVTGEAPMARLAARIARTIRGWLDTGEMLAGKGRPIRPGDILILVRRRNAFVGEMVRHLKTLGIPVAGADRMVLTEQMAVMDLMALGHFVLLPEDDLTLAAVLKGPFVGLTEDELFDLAWQRKGSLWQALRDKAATKPRYAEAEELLARLLDRADFEPPYEFFAHVLAGEEGRKRLLERLGPDAADPIDEFLSLALEFERDHAPSLEAFLHWLERGAAEIKRDMDQGRDEVRVMTVHGAKGLEADIVFMPDTCAAPGGAHDPALLSLPPLGEDGPELLLWPVRRKDEDDVSAGARERLRELRAAEYRRLLYVAMTRARDRLYIGGYRGINPPSQDCWYEMICEALIPLAVEIEAENGRKIWRIEGKQKRKVEAPADGEVGELPPLPVWVAADAPSEPSPSRPLAPSRLPPEGTSEPPGSSPVADDGAARFRRGSLIHRLLQTLPDLPSEERRVAAKRYLSLSAHGLDESEGVEIENAVFHVLENTKLAGVFAPGSRAEVPVAGMIRFRGRPLLVGGQIDRLCIAEREVIIVDYKTNRPPPKTVDEVAPAYIAQMAAYRAVLAEIYPDRVIRCALLWTEEPELMLLPAEMLENALAAA